jgi:general secretion pathway protein L
MAGPLLGSFFQRQRAPISVIVWLPARASAPVAAPANGLADTAALTVWRRPGVGPERCVLGTLKGVKEIVIVLDPRDVLLVTATVPPLTGTRLEQALPNLIEDALLQDPAACRIALGPELGEGRRVLGVVDREWYDLVVAGFARQGIRVAAAWPAPLAIPWREGTWSIAWVGSSLTIRLGPADGFGIEAEIPNLESSAAALLALAQTTIPFEGTVNLYADDTEALKVVQSAVRAAGLVGVTHSMPVPVPASIDLQQAVAGRSRQGRPAVKVSWPRWRWTVALGALCAITAISCLNLQWGLMSKESAAIEAAIEQRVRTVLPARIPIVDASLQMQRRLDVARIRAGEPATDDATALLTRLAAALGPRAMDALISADYRDGRLRVRFQPGWADAAAARESLREAAGRERLRLQFEERDPVAIVSLGS